MRLLRLSLVLAVVGCASKSTTGTGGNGDTGGNPEPGVDGGVTTSCTGKTQPANADDTWTIMSGGAMRTLNVHVPATYDPSQPMALVLNFHGYSSNAMQEDFLSQMSAKADAAGFIAIHPEGTQNSWNAGACCGQAAQDNVDDVAFTKAILDEAESKLCVDQKRIFVTGMSNGGFMSNRLGCELADRIAAIAPVAGVTGITTCAPSRPMPVIHFHGTADTLVPYDGNASMGFLAVPDDFAAWGQRDQCTDSPSTTFTMGDVTCSSYLHCAGGAQVTLCTVQNGGHTWPGGTPIPGLGYTTTNIRATDAMWSFFQAHPLP
jgi:polyhydroxybutyrate depolymerase